MGGRTVQDRQIANTPSRNRNARKYRAKLIDGEVSIGDLIITKHVSK